MSRRILAFAALVLAVSVGFVYYLPQIFVTEALVRSIWQSAWPNRTLEIEQFRYRWPRSIEAKSVLVQLAGEDQKLRLDTVQVVPGWNYLWQLLVTQGNPPFIALRAQAFDGKLQFTVTKDRALLKLAELPAADLFSETSFNRDWTAKVATDVSLQIAQGTGQFQITVKQLKHRLLGRLIPAFADFTANATLADRRWQLAEPVEITNKFARLTLEGGGDTAGSLDLFLTASAPPMGIDWLGKALACPKLVASAPFSGKHLTQSWHLRRTASTDNWECKPAR